MVYHEVQFLTPVQGDWITVKDFDESTGVILPLFDSAEQLDLEEAQTRLLFLMKKYRSLRSVSIRLCCRPLVEKVTTRPVAAPRTGCSGTVSAMDSVRPANYVGVKLTQGLLSTDVCKTQ